MYSKGKPEKPKSLWSHSSSLLSLEHSWYNITKKLCGSPGWLCQKGQMSLEVMSITDTFFNITSSLLRGVFCRAAKVRHILTSKPKSANCLPPDDPLVTNKQSNKQTNELYSCIDKFPMFGSWAVNLDF